MNVTRLAGWILLIFAGIYLVISLADFGPEYAAAGAIGEDAEKYGLTTSGTNLRFAMGLEFFIDILIIGVVAIAGWWLTTTEVTQIVWIILIGIFTIFSIVIRTSPVMPITALKLSPGAAFYGAQVLLPVGADVTFDYTSGQPARQYVVVTKKQAVQVAKSITLDGKPSETVVLDLGKGDAANQYKNCNLPLTIKGTVAGTASFVKTGTKDMTTVPLVKVQSAKSGMPEMK